MTQEGTDGGDNQNGGDDRGSVLSSGDHIKVVTKTRNKEEGKIA